MHILITRPEPDASAWSAHLAARGVAVTVDPLLRIEHIAFNVLDLSGIQALIATSRNGLRGLAMSQALAAATELPLFAVGQGTAEFARELGFPTVHAGPASARELVGVITANAAPSAGRLLHLSGDKIAFDLAAALAPLGFDLERRVVYRSRPAEALKPATVAALAGGAIDTVMLMSPLAARTFVFLVSAEGMGEQCQRLVYICLSQNVAGRLATLMPSRVRVAAVPNSDGLMAVIEELAGASNSM